MLGINNPSQVIRDVLDNTEYATVKKSNLSNTHISFPNRGMLCVSESGLYTLIFKSRKPEAQDFRKWVTSVVLPTIRKTGSYIAGEENFVAEGLTIDQMAAIVGGALQKKLDALKAVEENVVRFMLLH